jgi:hypothetical protein
LSLAGGDPSGAHGGGLYILADAHIERVGDA